MSLEVKKLLTDKEVSEIYNLGLQRLRNDRTLRRGLPYVRIGRSIRYRPEDIEDVIQKNRVNPEAA